MADTDESRHFRTGRRPADTAIRQALAKVLADSGLLQTEIAARAGLRQPHISDIMCGRRSDLRADTVARLAKACRLTPEELGLLLYRSLRKAKESAAS